MNATVTDIRSGARHLGGESHFVGGAVNYNEALGATAATANGHGKHTAKPEMTPEEKRIQAAEGTKNWLLMPWTLELGAILAGPIKFVFEKMKWTRGHVIFDALITNPIQALRKTTLGDIFHLRANYVEARAESVVAANEVASKIHTKWDGTKAAANATAKAEALAKKAKTLHGSAEVRGQGIASSKFITGLRKSGGEALDNFARTGFGQRIETGLQGFFNGRHKKLEAKHASKLEAAESAFTTEPKKGLGILPSSKGGAAVELGEHLEPHLAKLKEAPKLHLDPKGHVDHLNEVLEDLRKFTAKSAPKGSALANAQSRAGAVIKQLEDAVHHAGGVHLYNPENAASLRGMAKGLAKGLGRVPVFHALIAAGTVAGLTAVALNAHKESHEAKEAYQEIVADLGGDKNSPYLQSINNAYKQQKRDGVVKTGANTISEAATFGFIALPGGAAMAMMAPSMLPAVVPMFIKENELLNAYAALKQEEKGKVQLEPAQKLQCVKHLVAGLPSVASHGGVYNMLVTPVAEEIMNRKLSVKDTLQLINNDKEFTAIASAAAAKQKEAQAAAEAAKQATKTGKTATAVAPLEVNTDKPAEKAVVDANLQPQPVNNAVPVAGTASAAQQLSAKQSAEAAYMAAEKPASAKVTGADKVVLGKVDQSQLAMANV